MEIKQNLPNYIDKYINNDIWNVSETEHYVFYYFKDSQAEKEIKKISETQEKAFENIINKLNLEIPKEKIKYYIYPTEDDKEKLMGDDGFAQAIWHDNSIHIVYTEKIKPIGEHEDTHLLTLSWGVAIGFFQEGLAEYMSGCVWGRNKNPAIDMVKEGIKNNKIPNIEDLFLHEFWMDNADENIQYYYPLSGEFTKFLINEHGLEKYKELYQNLKRENSKEKNIKIFEDIYGNLKDCFSKYLATVL